MRKLLCFYLLFKPMGLYMIGGCSTKKCRQILALSGGMFYTSEIAIMVPRVQPPVRKHDLWNHQLLAYEFSYPKDSVLISAGMGTGKTCMATTLADNWDSKRVLVLCPAMVRGTWFGQIPQHSCRDLDIEILDRGSVAKRTERAAEAFAKTGTNLFLVANYEAAWREPLRSFILSKRWDAVICDESHRIMKESKTATFARQLHDVADRRVCLSGTSMTQDPMSCWAQCRFLDPNVFGESLDVFLYWFSNPYSVSIRKRLTKRLEQGLPPIDMSYWPSYITSGILNEDIFWDRLSKIAIRIENSVLNLPPLIVEKRTFSLSDDSRRLYDAIYGGYLDNIEQGLWPDVRGSFAVTMRLQQITSGWLPNREKAIVEVDSGKADVLRDILDEAGGEPVVVFARFVHDLSKIQAIAAEMGLPYGEISSRRKDGVNDKSIQVDGLSVIGVQEAAGGIGIDLSKSRICVDYSPSWSLEKYDQKIARLHRPPQNRPVVLYQIVCENSVDEEIHRAIRCRREIVALTNRKVTEIHANQGA